LISVRMLPLMVVTVLCDRSTSLSCGCMLGFGQIPEQLTAQDSHRPLVEMKKTLL
jgi:hypothetical protein